MLVVTAWARPNEERRQRRSAEPAPRPSDFAGASEENPSWRQEGQVVHTNCNKAATGGGACASLGSRRCPGVPVVDHNWARTARKGR